MNLSRRLVSSFVLVGILIASLSFAAEARRVVNVNTADASQLALLPRVGPAVAQRILDFRKENGPFKSTEDLMLVQGIGEKTYQLIKPYVAVSGGQMRDHLQTLTLPAAQGLDSCHARFSLKKCTMCINIRRILLADG